MCGKAGARLHPLHACFAYASLLEALELVTLGRASTPAVVGPLPAALHACQLWETS